MGRTSDGKAPRFHYAFVIVFCCIVIVNVPMGLFYGCSGLFFTPVAAYLGVPTASFTLYFSISNLAILLGLPAVARIVDRFDIRAVAAVSSALLAAAFWGMSRAHALWQFWLCGAVMGISAIPHLYFIIPTLIASWFRVRIAFFTGLSFSFMGVSGIVFSPILSSVIASSPQGWRSAYALMAAAIALATIPLALFVVRSDPHTMGLEPYGDGEASELAAEDGAGATLSEALRCTSFWGLLAYNGIIMMANTIMQFIPSYAQSFSAAQPGIAAMAGMLASAALLGQTLANLALGAVCDRSIEKGLALGLVLGASGMLALWFASNVPAVLLCGSFLFGCGYASAGVANPLLPRAVFGSRDYNAIYARISMGGAIVSVFASVLWGIIVDMDNGFPLMFSIGIACLAVATAAARFALANRWKTIGKGGNDASEG